MPHRYHRWTAHRRHGWANHGGLDPYLGLPNDLGPNLGLPNDLGIPKSHTCWAKDDYCGERKAVGRGEPQAQEDLRKLGPK